MIVLGNGYVFLRYDQATDTVQITELGHTPADPTVRSAVPLTAFLADLRGEDIDEEFVP